MSDAYYVGAVGLQMQQRALDTIANNIANINTPAFKRSELRFREVMATRSDPEVAAADLAWRSDPAIGVTLDKAFMVNEQGELQQTGHAMDLAVNGSGFIELMGPEGQTLLWRGGTLKINEDGQLATDRGIALKAAITIPQDATALTIGSDGVVRATIPDSADPVELGQIDLVRVEDAEQLDRLDGGLYRVHDDVRLSDAKPGEDGMGLFVQGSVERSNVALTDEMVHMMLIQRAFAANAQVLQASDQLMALANDLRK